MWLCREMDKPESPRMDGYGSPFTKKKSLGRKHSEIIRKHGPRTFSLPWRPSWHQHLRPSVTFGASILGGWLIFFQFGPNRFRTIQKVPVVSFGGTAHAEVSSWKDPRTDSTGLFHRPTTRFIAILPPEIRIILEFGERFGERLRNWKSWVDSRRAARWIFGKKGTPAGCWVKTVRSGPMFLVLVGVIYFGAFDGRRLLKI